MINKKNFFQITLLSFLALGLVQCGKDDSESDKVKISSIPENPVVIDADFTYTTPSTDPAGAPVEHTAEGPWFAYRYSIKNNSSETVTIQTIKLSITSLSSTTAAFESNLDPGEFDGFYLESLAPGASTTPNVVWVIDGLPTNTATTESLKTYLVKGEMIGWFGTPTNPTKAFSKKFSFTATQ